jgi:hypothetical protein
MTVGTGAWAKQVNGVWSGANNPAGIQNSIHGHDLTQMWCGNGVWSYWNGSIFTTQVGLSGIPTALFAKAAGDVFGWANRFAYHNTGAYPGTWSSKDLLAFWGNQGMGRMFGGLLAGGGKIWIAGGIHGTSGKIGSHNGTWDGGSPSGGWVDEGNHGTEIFRDTWGVSNTNIMVAGGNHLTYVPTVYQTLDGSNWDPVTTGLLSSWYIRGVWGVSISLAEPPVLQNEDPASGETDVEIDSNVTFEVVETVDGVDNTTTIINVNGEVAWTGGSAATGFAGTETAIADGYRYVINPDEDFDVATQQSVRVRTDSLGGESLDTAYSFTTVPRTSEIIAQQFSVHQISIVGSLGTSVSPVLEHNQFDEHGLLVSLDRLREEKNWEYKRRILDVFSHQANSSYRGMIHGITRGLGLSLFQPIVIWMKLDPVTSRFAAPDPYVKFDGIYLHLYSDFANDELVTINRFQPGGNYEHITRLVDVINTSFYFGASIEPEIDPYTRSMTIMNQSNRVRFGEFVQASTKFRLEKDKLVQGSVQFGETVYFKSEVASENYLSRRGDYYIDYWNGIVSVYTPPAIETVIHYEYTEQDFKPWASPVILHSISDENFGAAMFDQILQDDGTLAHGLPTRLGSDVINELLGVTPMYWGV